MTMIKIYNRPLTSSEARIAAFTPDVRHVQIEKRLVTGEIKTEPLVKKPLSVVEIDNKTFWQLSSQTIHSMTGTSILES